jgi:hypothetical protein
MKTSLSGSEPLNGVAEPGRDFLEINVFDVTKSVRAKIRCNAGRLETAGPTFSNFLKLFGPLLYRIGAVKPRHSSRGYKAPLFFPFRSF